MYSLSPVYQVFVSLSCLFAMPSIPTCLTTCAIASAIAPFFLTLSGKATPKPTNHSYLKSIQIAQIVPDSTLENNSQVIQNQNRIDIEGGTQAGSNLFHSFREFSIPADTTATFQNSNAIQNIITRVTGDRTSFLQGTLRTLGNANLILINPNGLTIGANAKLDIGGSFLGSTAHTVEFADGRQFSASQPSPSALLTVSVPIGLQVGTNAGDIQVFGPGNNLFFDSSLATVREERPNGFAVAPQQTLALIGGNILLSGGNLTAQGGKIQLTSIGKGNIRLNSNASGWDIQPQNVSTWNNIRLEQTASIEASGNGGGFVHLQGSQILLRDGSSILADTLGNGTGQGVYLEAQESVEIIGESPEGFASSVFAAVAPEASGSGGRLQVATKRFVVADRAIIGTDTFGSGNAGTLKIDAREVETRGRSVWSGSSFSDATGDGGNIVINTETLNVIAGTQILAFTKGAGHAGAIEIQAADAVEIRGADGSLESVIAASVESSSTGQGGNVTIETDRLVLANGGRLSTATSSQNPNSSGGNVTIRATSAIQIAGSSKEGIPAAITTNTVGNGRGGRVRLETPRLILQNGGQVSSASFQSGNGGDVLVKVRDALQISGSVPAQDVPETDIDFFRDNTQTRFPSGLATSTDGSGHAGQLQVDAGAIEVQLGGEISVSSTGTGNAGSMAIAAEEINLARRGRLRADSTAGLGNINLQTDNLVLQGNSQISTNSTGSVPGGNITLATDTLASLGNSDITANAIAGDGGNIQITTSALFLSANSDVTASSQFGVDGRVAVNSPDIEPEAGFFQVEKDLNQQTQIVATACQRTEGSEFIITGYGGMPPNPHQALNQFSTWMDWRDSQPSPQTSPASSTTHEVDSSHASIREARGWIRRPDGTVELVASMASGQHWYRWCHTKSDLYKPHLR